MSLEQHFNALRLEVDADIVDYIEKDVRKALAEKDEKIERLHKALQKLDSIAVLGCTMHAPSVYDITSRALRGN